MTETLLELAQKYHSDKCANGASKYGYIPYYEKHFKPIKNDQLNIILIRSLLNRGRLFLIERSPPAVCI